jgi:hypothetical protein
VPNGALIWASTGGERVGKGWFSSEEKGQKLLLIGGKFTVVFTVRGIVDIQWLGKVAIHWLIKVDSQWLGKFYYAMVGRG